MYGCRSCHINDICREAEKHDILPTFSSRCDTNSPSDPFLVFFSVNHITTVLFTFYNIHGQYNIYTDIVFNIYDTTVVKCVRGRQDGRV